MSTEQNANKIPSEEEKMASVMGVRMAQSALKIIDGGQMDFLEQCYAIEKTKQMGAVNFIQDASQARYHDAYNWEFFTRALAGRNVVALKALIDGEDHEPRKAMEQGEPKDKVSRVQTMAYVLCRQLLLSDAKLPFDRFQAVIDLASAADWNLGSRIESDKLGSLWIASCIKNSMGLKEGDQNPARSALGAFIKGQTSLDDGELWDSWVQELLSFRSSPNLPVLRFADQQQAKAVVNRTVNEVLDVMIKTGSFAPERAGQSLAYALSDPTAIKFLLALGAEPEKVNIGGKSLSEVLEAIESNKWEALPMDMKEFYTSHPNFNKPTLDFSKSMLLAWQAEQTANPARIQLASFRNNSTGSSVEASVSEPSLGTPPAVM